MNKLTERQITVNDRLVTYYASGKNGARNLVFLHGWRSGGLIWMPILKSLAGDAAIYCLDLPGFGKSQDPDRAYEVHDYAEIVSSFISKLALDNVVVIGHSFGGRIAIKLAAARPQFLRGIVLIDSAGFVSNTPSGKLKRCIARSLRPIFKPKAFRGLRSSIYRWMGAEDYIATPKLRDTYLKIVAEDLSDDMRRIATQTLIIWGSEDKDTPLAGAYKMQKLIQGSKLVVLKGAGHFSFLDKERDFLNTFNNYLLSL